MIEVKCSILAIEQIGAKDQLINARVVISSHWNRPELVVVEMTTHDGTELSPQLVVNGNELIAAIKNAMNTAR